jgi:hypothetical protein
LADKLDLIETDLNSIRTLLNHEKLALNDLKQNLAPISEFLNLPIGEKAKKKSVNFDLSADRATTVPSTTTVIPDDSQSQLSSQNIGLLSEEEFEQVPKYLKGRLTATKINSFIQYFNRFLAEKYGILFRSNPAKLSIDQRQKFFEWKAAELEELGGRIFLTEADFKAKNGQGHFKFDQVARNILTILRQVGRIKEVRSSGIIRYVIN